MPIDDWQFWVVTVLFLAGLWLIARLFVPAKRGPGATSATTGPRKRRVPLTIDRAPAGRRRRG